MTTILVPTSGTATDMSVFATAFVLAQPLRAHMDFYHVRLTPCEAAVRAPHVSFCIGGAVSDALNYLEHRDKTLEKDAMAHFMDFCDTHPVLVQDRPTGDTGVSVQWIEETNDAEKRFLFRARHSDLVILGRPTHTDLMPVNLIETLLTHSGRPIVLAPRTARQDPIRTVVVGWKETAECARALTAAMPILARAERVMLFSVEEACSSTADIQAIHDLARQLAWSGVAAEARMLPSESIPTAKRLTQAALEADADLLVVGGFGHSAMREHVFGGATRDLLDDCRLPVFLTH